MNFLNSYERDTESGLDYFGARYYASSMGRWMSPDWSAKEDPVPYAKLDDPQSLNLYGYVENNPLSRADADGHCFPFCLPAFAGAGGETGAASTAGEAGLGAFIASNPVGWGVGAGIVVVGGGALIYEHYHPGAITGLFKNADGEATSGAKGAITGAEETNKEAEKVLGSEAATEEEAAKLSSHVADQKAGIEATRTAVNTLNSAKGQNAKDAARQEVKKQTDLLKGHSKDIQQQINKINK
jgi:RHS repeat-associated protein